MFPASAPETESFPFPTQFVYERSAGRLRIAVDVAPAARDDVTVEVDSTRVRVAIDHDDGVSDRTVSPLPPSLVFDDDDRTAVYNNGVLSVTLGTRPRVGSGRTR